MDACQVTDDYVVTTCLKRWGISPKRTGREWHSPCAVCGGHDRFIIFSNGGFYCRQCELKGFLDDDQKQIKRDPALLLKWKEDIEAQEHAKQERDTEWRKGFKAGYIKGWHDCMQTVNRLWWNSQGIDNHLIEKYRLGYIPSKTVKTERGEIELPAYVIPVIDPDTDEVANIQYRLVDPPDGVGKYRQVNGISAREFYAEGRDLEGDTAIVLEGAKKAIITFDRLDAAIQVIGLPGCTPSESIVNRLKRYGKIWIALDPGAEQAAERLRAKLPQARVMKLPGKPDDLFLSGMSAEQFKEFARLAR